MLGLLHFIPDIDDPRSLTRYYLDALAPGSYLAISHASSDIDTEPQEAAVKRYNSRSATPIVLRSKAEVARFFDGLDLVSCPASPRSASGPPARPCPATASLPTYTALARKAAASRLNRQETRPGTLAPARCAAAKQICRRLV